MPGVCRLSDIPKGLAATGLARIEFVWEDSTPTGSFLTDSPFWESVSLDTIWWLGRLILVKKQREYMTKISRKLRREMSLPEVLLWNQLRPKINKQCVIHRQVPFLNLYVVDFYCAKLKLAIEIDGRQIHEGQEVKDAERQAAIEQLGIRFLRIGAKRVLKNPYEVAQLIIEICIGELQLEDLEP